MSTDWRKDLGTYKILNMERPGDPIEIGFNAEPIWQFQHGAIATIPKAVAQALNDTVKIKHRIKGKLGESNSVETYEEQRYMAVPVESAKKEEPKTDLLMAIAKGKRSKVEDGVE